MKPFLPKTVSGKLLFAYLSLVCVFVSTGIFVLAQLNTLRNASNQFFIEYSATEDLIISSRFFVGQVSNVILSPTSSLEPDLYISETKAELRRIAAQYQNSVLSDDLKQEVAESLSAYNEAISAPLLNHKIPVEMMQAADEIADRCILQAEKIHNVQLVNALAGIVDAYTDTLLTNDPDEREQFDKLVRVVENDPSGATISLFPQLKKLALSVFSAQSQYLFVAEKFERTSHALSSKLASIDKQFHTEFLLPNQNKFVSYLEQSVWVVVFALFFSVLMATVISLILTRRIWRPLSAVGDMVSRMTDGDLNHRLPPLGEDEVAQIGRSLNLFADQLKQSLEQLDRQMVEMTAVESELRKSEDYSRTLSHDYQVVLDGISEALMVFNRQGGIVWSNKKASEEIYAEIDKKVSAGDYEANPDSFYYVGNELVDLCLSTADSVEKLINTSSGKFFRVKVFPLLDESGQLNRVLKVVSDISDQFQFKEEAERSNRLASLGELSAGVAHEINNPNSLVIVNAPIVSEAFDDILPILETHFAKHGDFQLAGLPYSRMKSELPLLLKEMHEGGMRIQRIVEDLKHFVRKDPVAQMERVDLNVSVETSLRLTRNLIKKSTDIFDLNLFKRLPLIKANQVALEQVIVNLIQNACLALPDRSRRLVVSTDFSDKDEVVLLFIKDEGVGIPPDDLKRITDPFFTTRRKEGGIGLGLSVSNRIIRDFGGQMLFESKPDLGTTVTVRLPIAK